MVQTPKIIYSEDFKGSRKITCNEAAELLKGDSVLKAWFRPDGMINFADPGSDPCFVWLRDKEDEPKSNK